MHQRRRKETLTESFEMAHGLLCEFACWGQQQSTKPLLCRSLFYFRILDVDLCSKAHTRNVLLLFVNGKQSFFYYCVIGFVFAVLLAYLCPPIRFNVFPVWLNSRAVYGVKKNRTKTKET